MTSTLRWRTAILPNVAWPEEYLRPEGQKWQEILFMFTGDRVMFPMGILFPISPSESSSYEFISRLSASAPFKMSPKYFSVIIRTGKEGTLVSRKPDADIFGRLSDAILHKT